MVIWSLQQPEKEVMNNPIRVKVKMLIVLMFCVFMTFSMLVFVMRASDKCGGAVCVDARKGPAHGDRYESEYLVYNLTQVSAKEGARVSTAGPVSARRTGREILKVSSLGDSGVGRSGGHSVGGMIGRSLFVGGEGEDVYARRRKELQKFCRKYFDSEEVRKMRKIRLNHILIDEKHKVLYCYVPKVACTNWKRVFLVLMGKVRDISEVLNLPSSEVHAKNLFKSLENYTIPEVQKMTEEYTKFIFVRHPFERLLSAYRNKLEQHYDSSKYFQARFGKYIIKNFRKNPSNVSLERGDDVTFAEFVNYLLSREPSSYNEHWQRVTDLCHPCLLNYDFIGKYETLREDSGYLLRSLGMNLSFPILTKPSTTATNLKKYYNTLGKRTIYKLYNIYKLDFRLFGYDLFNVSDWSNNS